MRSALDLDLDFIREALATHRVGEPIDDSLLKQIVEVVRATGRSPGEVLTDGLWSRILPGQQEQIIAALEEDEAPSTNDVDTKPPGESRGGAPEASLVSTPQQRGESNRYVDDPLGACRPFPVEALPAVAADYVHEGARALGVDPSFFALPTLAMLASCIGTVRVAKVGPEWFEPCIVWVAIVASSGSMKTPAFKRALQPLSHAEDRAATENAEAMRGYAKDRLEYERQLTRFRREKDASPPDEPEAPKLRRHVVSDITVEALAPILQANPRGVFLRRDELSGVVADFDAYKGTRGGDVTRFLSLWSAEPITVDRKGGATIRVPLPAVSIAGTIQPRILAQTLGTALIDNGFASRLLLAMPPRDREPVLPRSGISVRAQARIDTTIKGLLRLEHLRDPDGNLVPVSVPFTPEALAAFEPWWVRCRKAAMNEQDTPLGYALDKMPGYCARFALLVELADRAERGEDAASIGPRSVQRAVALADWFAHEAARVYGRLAEAPERAELRALEEWVARQGGVTTAAELARSGPRKYRERKAAEQALDRLVAGGRATWEDYQHPRGGRSTRRARLRGVETQLP